MEASKVTFLSLLNPDSAVGVVSFSPPLPYRFVLHRSGWRGVGCSLLGHLCLTLMIWLGGTVISSSALSTTFCCQKTCECGCWWSGFFPPNCPSYVFMSTSPKCHCTLTVGISGFQPGIYTKIYLSSTKSPFYQVMFDLNLWTLLFLKHKWKILPVKCEYFYTGL